MDRPPRWRDGSLFANQARSDELPPGTLRIAELATRVHQALRDVFARRVWVVGEVAELGRSLGKKHWFFQLCGNDAATGRRFAMGAVLWGDEQLRLFGRGGSLRGVIEPADGIEIRALVEVDFNALSGALRLVIRDIDPTFTLGRIAIERRKLIDKLTLAGVMETQRRLVLAAVPLRIGLITSRDSAAFNDFVQEIRGCGVAFTLEFHDARMQGEATVATVLRGLGAMVARRVDVIALVRGGGSASDLAWFDKEEIARAIAGCPIPVITGIGHEIDTSVADLVAHRSFKTPTAVAAFLAECGRAALRELADAQRRLALVAERPVRELHRLRQDTRTLCQAVSAALLAEQALAGRARRSLLRQPRRLRDDRLALGAAPRRLAALCGQQLLGGRRDLRRQPVRLQLAIRSALDRATFAVTRGRVELTRSSARIARATRERLAAWSSRLRGLDPEQVLRRGFALVRDASGKLIKDASGVPPGAAIDVVLRDGALRATVDPDPATRPPRKRTRESKADGEQEDRGPGRRQLEIW